MRAKKDRSSTASAPRPSLPVRVFTEEYLALLEHVDTIAVARLEKAGG